MPQDLLIRGARILDGSGAPWFRGDVRIAGGRIAAMGPDLAADGAAILDADGLYLAPGFIDAHTHDDLIFLREPDRPEKIVQGVTTIVTGNCSFSLYPRTPDHAEDLRGHFSTLFGETAASETFAGFADYRAEIEARGIAINLVSLVGHGALRLAVTGYDRRPATSAELAEMQRLLARQLADGAAGLSLGLVYPPSAFADQAELVALAGTVADHGAVLAAHIRSYEAALVSSVDEFLALLAQTGAQGLLSHLQAAGRPNWGGVPKALARLDAARADGVDVSFDMYPYPAGSSYILQLLPPDWLEGGVETLLQRLADPAARAALQAAIETGSADTALWQSKIGLIGWDNVRISAVTAAELKPIEGRSIAAAAADAGIAPFDLLLDLLVRDRGQTGIVMFQLSDDDLRAAFTHPLHMVGSDSLPRPGSRSHPRIYGSFPRVAGHLARDLGWFPLADAIRRMTSVAAQRFGLFDRGMIRPGLVADLVLFEPGIQDNATFDNPTELATGVRHVWVAGTAVLADGRPLGTRPGRVLSRTRSGAGA